MEVKDNVKSELDGPVHNEKRHRPGMARGAVDQVGRGVKQSVHSMTLA